MPPKKSKCDPEKHSSFLYNLETEYAEPYMRLLNVEEITRGSVVSIPPIKYDICESTTLEIPWNQIGLPKQGTYELRKIEKKVKHAEGIVVQKSVKPVENRFIRQSLSSYNQYVDLLREAIEDSDQEVAWESQLVVGEPPGEGQAQEEAPPEEAPQEEAPPPEETQPPEEAPPPEEPSPPQEDQPAGETELEETEVQDETEIPDESALPETASPIEEDQEQTPPSEHLISNQKNQEDVDKCQSCTCCGDLAAKKKRRARRRKQESVVLTEHFKCTFEEDCFYVEPYLEELDVEINPEPKVSPCTSRTEMPWEDILIPKNIYIPRLILKKDSVSSNCKCGEPPPPPKDFCTCSDTGPIAPISQEIEFCTCEPEPEPNECTCDLQLQPDQPKEEDCTCKPETKTEPPKDEYCTCEPEPEPPKDEGCSCKPEHELEPPKDEGCTCKPESEHPEEEGCICKPEPEPEVDYCTCEPEPETCSSVGQKATSQVSRSTSDSKNRLSKDIVVTIKSGNEVKELYPARGPAVHQTGSFTLSIEVKKGQNEEIQGLSINIQPNSTSLKSITSEEKSFSKSKSIITEPKQISEECVSNGNNPGTVSISNILSSKMCMCPSANSRALKFAPSDHFQQDQSSSAVASRPAAPGGTLAETSSTKITKTKMDCNCVNASTSGDLKENLVIKTLESCQAEMKPLREVLDNLKDKIRDLNLPATNAMMRPDAICVPCGNHRNELRSTYINNFSRGQPMGYMRNYHQSSMLSSPYPVSPPSYAPQNYYDLVNSNQRPLRSGLGICTCYPSNSPKKTVEKSTRTSTSKVEITFPPESQKKSNNNFPDGFEYKYRISVKSSSPFHNNESEDSRKPSCGAHRRSKR